MRSTADRLPLALGAILVAAALVLAGCGGGGDDRDPETDGPRDQAVERLVDFGLSEEQATCLVDELGAETVVETAELTGLTEGEPYQQAAEECLDAG